MIVIFSSWGEVRKLFRHERFPAVWSMRPQQSNEGSVLELQWDHRGRTACSSQIHNGNGGMVPSSRTRWAGKGCQKCLRKGWLHERWQKVDPTDIKCIDFNSSCCGRLCILSSYLKLTTAMEAPAIGYLKVTNEISTWRNESTQSDSHSRESRKLVNEKYRRIVRTRDNPSTKSN